MITSFFAHRTQLFVGTFIVLAIVLGLWSYTKATGTVISACVTKNGDVRIPADGACRNTETPISWNVQGPKGDKGDQGAAGSSLHVFDANGQDLGLALDADMVSGHIRVYVPNSRAVFSFEENRSLSGTGFINSIDPTGSRGVYYDGENCQGSPFVTAGPQIQQIQPGFGIATSSRFFVATTESLVSGHFASILMNGICLNETYNGPAYGLSEVPAPFNLPLAWPLQIKQI